MTIEQQNRKLAGNCIARRRKLMKLTQVELAERSGLTQGNVARVEAGKYNVTLDVLTKICTVLNCTPTSLEDI
jgi:transcriptional regulator with XRE-family HTH domain